MRAMGFGPRFISYLEILYRDAQGLVKVGGSLTSPFSFEKGIRQGCPLSGLLYSIAIEPLINILRQKLSTSCFTLPGSNLPCAVSAYADDVSVFVTSDRGFDAIEEAYNLFARSSAACLNTSKSQGLWAGSWTGRNDKPLNFSWNSEGLPFLGVHLGNTHKYVQKNWDKCKDKLNKTLSSWSRLSHSLSFKGKVIIANQLAASKLFHPLAVLSPPENILSELQGSLVDFVWSNKRHYLKKELLYKKPDRGGLGLVCLQARVLTFRFSTIQRFLNLYPHPSYSLVSHFLRQYRKLDLDYQLFHFRTNPKFHTNLPLFYSELLRAWTASGARIDARPDSINHVLNLPVNHPTISNAADDDGDASPPVRLAACGVGLVRHLVDFNTGLWIDPHTLTSSYRGLRAPSLRLLQADIQRLRRALQSLFPSIFSQVGCRSPPSVLQSVSVKPDVPVAFTLPPSVKGLSAPSKVIYTHFNNEIFCGQHSSPLHWHDVGFLNATTKIQWLNIYQLPTSKKEGDLQFKLLHNFLPSLCVLHHLNPDISSFCGWCGEKGSIQHLFITCPAIQPTLNLLHALISRLLSDLLLNFDVYWALISHAKGRRREAVRLANFLIISCKNVIYRLYQTSCFTDPLILWKHKLKSKILLDYSYYNLCGNLSAFLHKWSLNNALFDFNNDKLTWLI